MRNPCWVLLLAACSASLPPESATTTDNVKATVGPQETIDLTRSAVVHATVFAQPRDSVWNALLAANIALGLEAEFADPARGRAVFVARDRTRTIAGRPASTVIDCGQGSAGARADTYRLTVKLTHALEAAPGGTNLKTSLEAFARNPGLSSDPVPCSSRGRLEREIATLVTTRLQ